MPRSCPETVSRAPRIVRPGSTCVTSRSSSAGRACVASQRSSRPSSPERACAGRTRISFARRRECARCGSVSAGIRAVSLFLIAVLRACPVAPTPPARHCRGVPGSPGMCGTGRSRYQLGNDWVSPGWFGPAQRCASGYRTHTCVPAKPIFFTGTTSAPPVLLHVALGHSSAPPIHMEEH